MVFLQGNQHHKRAQMQLQHSEPLQNEQPVQDGHEDHDILKEGKRGEKHELAPWW